MEKIKVNMSPNPLDVQTIHASQNDGEARQWEFELHNNGELIDTSDVKEQMFFKSYKGGTEHILPENTSTPTTSPFLGDIRYPQGLLTDQEFTYRQSPTEEDGLAKITDIKGNTIVWNQLYEDRSQASSASELGITRTYGNENLITLDGTATGTANFYINSNAWPRTFLANHKYLFLFKPQGAVNQGVKLVWNPQSMQTSDGSIITSQSVNVSTNGALRIQVVNGTSLSNYNVRISIFDLTKMGLDITDQSDFTSLFNLSYYAYNQGSLLSFNGNGIKTVGFNQWNEQWETGGLDVQNGNPYTDNSRIRTKNFNQCFENTVYYNSAPQQAIVLFYDGNFGYLGYVGANARSTFTTKANARYFKFYMATAYGTTYNNDICINISSDKDGTYEPYTETTTDLPISTYFPTGMKRAGNVYDELTESKAITRVGVVDLGSLIWSYSNGVFSSSNAVGKTQVAGSDPTIVCPLYIAKQVGYNASYEGEDKVIWQHPSSTLRVRDSAYTSASAFKTAMNGVYIYYELATPTETSFTTASLVTENAEIPLSNEDGVLIGKCTEELSAEPGFHDAKIKLADSDGECYSNKIQLHIERSPQ